MGAGTQLPRQRRLRLLGIVQHAEIRDVTIDLVVEVVLIHAQTDPEYPHQRGRDTFHLTVVSLPHWPKVRGLLRPKIGSEKLRRLAAR
jgi:hypothetical protein